MDEVSTDMASSMLTVTGRVDPTAIQARVESKTGRKVELIVPKEAESNEPEGEKEESNVPERVKEVVIEPTPLAVEVNSVPYYGSGEYNLAYSHPYREEMEHATHLFSDENPNACTVM